MVMERDPICKFRKSFNFGLILHLISQEFTKFLVKEFFTSEVIGQKVRVGGHPSPVPSGLKNFAQQAGQFTCNWFTEGRGGG